VTCDLTGKCRSKAIFRVTLIGHDEKPQMNFNLCRKCLKDLSDMMEEINAPLQVKDINDKTG